MFLFELKTKAFFADTTVGTSREGGGGGGDIALTNQGPFFFNDFMRNDQ